MSNPRRFTPSSDEDLRFYFDECAGVIGLATVSLTSIPADKTYLRTEVRFSNDVDLSPLANLATAAAWGIGLERVLQLWTEWHPAARIDWRVSDKTVRLTFLVDGIGVVNDYQTRIDRLDRDGSMVRLTSIVTDSKREAAYAMAPHYVAPTPKPANRDAALRRFADGVTR